MSIEIKLTESDSLLTSVTDAVAGAISGRTTTEDSSRQYLNEQFFTICVCCIGISFLILELCAFITGCVDIDSHCNDALNLHASGVLISGVIITLIFGIIACYFGCSEKEYDKQIIIGLLGMYVGMIFIISCIGFTVYNNSSDYCRTSALGQMLVVWSIVHFVLDLCQCGIICCLCMNVL